MIMRHKSNLPLAAATLMIAVIASDTALADSFGNRLPTIGDSREAVLSKLGPTPVADKTWERMGLRVEVLEFHHGLWTTRVALVLGRVIAVEAHEGVSAGLFN